MLAAGGIQVATSGASDRPVAAAASEPDVKLLPHLRFGAAGEAQPLGAHTATRVDNRSVPLTGPYFSGIITPMCFDYGMKKDGMGHSLESWIAVIAANTNSH